ncbi:PLAT/LH2 domain-containing protein [Bacillus sp. CECT 9360]|uniref:PLAT/LH2 domain-containing protein n=1 Tax=Bacillus sp. CECT 9360 TaxID=2845821 RepID=UPI001E4737A2|nr:PLAT/LH2 domain-containing protein [Bacillus sp. CECT 9360]CAH0347479.1 hypothetical protein BCI9360_03879 [Bacillus sp. CECT 9360]
MKYEVRVKTSDEEGSGSDSNVYFTFCGTADKSKQLGPYTNFERGKTKKFIFSTYEELGDIDQLIIHFKRTENSTDFKWSPFTIQVLPLPDYRNHPGWLFMLNRVLNCEHGTHCYRATRTPYAGKSASEGNPYYDKPLCSFNEHECTNIN